MARCSVALTALQLAVLLCCTVAQVDKSEEHGAIGTDVVIATVNRIRISGIFPDDFQFQFLRRMAYVETRDGETAIEGNGGIWNVNSEVFGRVQGFLTTPRGFDFADSIKDTFDFEWFVLTRQDLDVPLYSALTVMLRIHITKDTEIPSETSAQAAIWNVLFNGSPFNGAEFDFIRDVGALEREGEGSMYYLCISHTLCFYVSFTALPLLKGSPSQLCMIP